MNETPESEVLRWMTPLFGAYAMKALAREKEKLGIRHELRPEDCTLVAPPIRELSARIAGTAVADTLYSRIVNLAGESE